MAEKKKSRTEELREKYKKSTASSYVRDDGVLRASSKDIYLNYTAPSAIKDITKKLQELDKKSQDVYNNYNSRFFDENGKTKTQYRSLEKEFFVYPDKTSHIVLI